MLGRDCNHSITLLLWLLFVWYVLATEHMLHPRCNSKSLSPWSKTWVMRQCFTVRTSMPWLTGSADLCMNDRGISRDVYRVGETLILKLIRRDTELSFRSMENDSIALIQTACLPLSLSLQCRGSVGICSCRSVTLTVDCLARSLMSQTALRYDSWQLSFCCDTCNCSWER